MLGLTRLTEAEHQELAELTKAYRERFGFPLIVSVRDEQNIDQILRSGWERLNNSPTQEHAAALIEIAKIAKHRFDELVADANPILSARTRHLDTSRGIHMTGTRRDVSVDGFNALPEAEATRRLLTCLNVPRWVEEVAGGRPYPDYAALAAQAEASAAQLSDDEIAAALAGHPRIGEQAGAGHDAEFSAQEQAQVDHADAAVMAALAEGNGEYEQRFDRVFVIRAAGRSATEILAELRRRLGNDDETERAEMVAALREIALLRLKDVV